MLDYLLTGCCKRGQPASTPARRLGSHASRASAAALAAWVTTWQPHEPVLTISGRCRLICVAQRLLPRLDRRGSAPIRPPAKSRQIAKRRAKLRRNLRMVGYSAQISSAFSAIWLNGITLANGGATPSGGISDGGIADKRCGTRPARTGH